MARPNELQAQTKGGRTSTTDFENTPAGGELGARNRPSDAVHRLAALRATNARDALEAANQLPMDDPDRIMVVGLVAGLCRRVEVSDEAKRFELLVSTGHAADTTKHRQLHSRQYSAMRAYCAGVSGSALLAQQEFERAEHATPPPGSHADDYAFLNAVANDPLVMEVGFPAAVEAVGASERLWRIAESSESPTLTRLAYDHLALSGDAAFPETSMIIGRGGGSDLIGTAEHRAEIVRVSAATLFWCRTFGSCGPQTIWGLWHPWVSELSATIGVEGTLQSTLSPVQWQAVESIYEQLRLRREAAQRR